MFEFDIFKAVESYSKVQLAGWRHVKRDGRLLIVSSQIQDACDDVLTWSITPEGVVTYEGRKPAFSE